MAGVGLDLQSQAREGLFRADVARSEGDVDLEEAENGSVAEDSRGCTLPACILRLLFPQVEAQLLRTGYGQLLVIQDYIHFCLWFSAFISSVFILIWFADLFSGNCLISLPSAKGWDSEGSALLRCGFEAIALLIFCGSLRDSFRMISHYDDDKQHFVEKRNREIEQTQEELKTALEGIRNLLQELSDMLKESTQKDLNDAVGIVFKVVLPLLREAERRKLESLSLRFENNLVEVSPAVCQVLLEQIRRRHAESVPTAPLKALKKCKAKATRLWKERWQRTLAAAGGRGTSSMAPIAEDDSAAAPDVLIDLEEVFQALGAGPSSIQSTLEGQPGGPGGAAGNRCCGCCCCCCLPRFLVPVLRCIKGVFCGACCKEEEGGCCENCLSQGNEYPKRCCCVELRTRLQEQLLQGIFFGLAFFVTRIVLLVMDLNDSRGDFANGVCENSASLTQLLKGWRCTYQVFKKLLSIGAMFWQVLCLLYCMCNISKLDAVEATLVTNKRLEETKEMLTAYNQFMEKLEGKRVVGDRYNARLQATIIYFTDPTRKLLTMLQAELLGTGKVIEVDKFTQELIDCLSSIADELGPLDQFFKLSQTQQKDKSEEIIRTRVSGSRWSWYQPQRGSICSDASNASVQSMPTGISWTGVPA